MATKKNESTTTTTTTYKQTQGQPSKSAAILTDFMAQDPKVRAALEALRNDRKIIATYSLTDEGAAELLTETALQNPHIAKAIMQYGAISIRWNDIANKVFAKI
jgi:hypothetical protein